MIARYFQPESETERDPASGYRLVATCSIPGMYACATVANRVMVFRDGAVSFSTGMQRFALKNRTEGVIQRIALGPEGDRLFVASGIGITCFETGSDEVAWQFRPSRFLGFMRSTPLDMVVCDDGGVLFSTNSGGITRLDRKGRVDFSVFDNDAPQSLSRFAGQAMVVGGDGHHVHVWSADDGSRIRSGLYRGRNYTVAASHDTVAVRVPGSYMMIPLDESRPTVTIPCGQGLPGMAWSADGKALATIQEGTIAVFDQDGTQVSSFAPAGCRVVSVAASHTGNGFIAGCTNEVIATVDS